MSGAWSTEARARYGAELRKVNPRRLTEWQGLRVTGGGWIHPYAAYVQSNFMNAPRDVQIADLLVGDLVLDVLLDDELKISDLATNDIWWPHRAAARQQGTLQ